MKKFLLMLVAFVATMSAFAQNDNDLDIKKGWAAAFKPVAEADDLNGVHVAQAGDGSVYVSSKQNVSFNFAGKAVAQPEVAKSSVIVKYDKDGKEQWAITFDGDATVTAMVADEDGTLYAAGIFYDVVRYTSTDLQLSSIESPDAVSAFITKVNKDGQFVSMKTLTPSGNLEVVTSDFPFYLPDEEPIDIRPNKIQIDGDKVYVSATYKGDVAELGWKGAYVVNYDFGMYMDNRSAGVFSLSKNDFANVANVAYVQSTGTISETQNYPEAVNFVANNGTVYVGFFGFGNLTITSAAGNKDIAFESDGEGGNEHGFVLATVGSTLTTKVFNAAAHAMLTKPYNVAMQMAGNDIIIAGTFFGELPFDNSLSTGDMANAAFVTSVKKDGTVNWANIVEKESKMASMLVTGEETHVSTNVATFIVKTSTGTISLDGDAPAEGDEVIVIADAAGWGNQYVALVVADENEVTVISKDMNEDDELEEGLIEIAQSQGKEYDNFKRAELVEGEKYNTYTVTEDLQIAIKMMNVDVKDCDYVVVKFAEPVAAGWKLAFWSNQDLTDIPEGAKEYKYVFADDPKCGVADGVLPQICMMTFFGGYTAPLEAKVVGIYKHSTDANAVEAIEAPAKTTNGQRYNLAGQPVDENYKGFVIIDGKTYYVK